MRNGYYTEELSEDQSSCIFLQWLDCVHQLLYQFPNAFEFNIDFLVYIASHYNTCLFGTFLFNCEREREYFKAKSDTVSIWSYTCKSENNKRFSNPFYNNSQTDLENVSWSIINMRIWDEFYLKYNKENSLNEFDVSLCKYKNCLKYFEYVKREDDEKIKRQKKTIDTYKNAIKDLSFLLSQSDISERIPETIKKHMENLNNSQIRDSSNNNCINVLENYI